MLANDVLATAWIGLLMWILHGIALRFSVPYLVATRRFKRRIIRRHQLREEETMNVLQ